MDVHRLPDRLVRIIELIALAAIPVFAAAKAPPRLNGYTAVAVRYAPVNKMVVSLQINGHPAKLLVDTGTSRMVLNTDAAPLLGVSPGMFGRRYIGYTRAGGQDVPLAFIKSVSAGGLNLGSSFVMLVDAAASRGASTAGRGHVDGAVGMEILMRHQAIINCRTRFIFFKADRAGASGIASLAGSEKFTRVPIAREQNDRLTVPFSLGGQTGRMFLDTGAFVTTFEGALLKSRGITLQPTNISARFSDGISRQYAMGQVNDLTIGDFKVPSRKFGAAALPNFARNLGATSITGILGMDLLYDSQAIIDLGSMSLFLK